MGEDEIHVAPTSEEEVRKEAVASIKRKQGFKQTLVAYVLVNAMLIAIWAIAGAGFFWPGFVLAGWGLGLAFQAYDAYARKHTISEDEIQREAQRIRSG
jgi:hypothetical protein